MRLCVADCVAHECVSVCVCVCERVFVSRTSLITGDLFQLDEGARKEARESGVKGSLNEGGPMKIKKPVSTAGPDSGHGTQ